MVWCSDNPKQEPGMLTPKQQEMVQRFERLAHPRQRARPGGSVRSAAAAANLVLRPEQFAHGAA
jgi:hypothetical protein